MKKQKVNVLYSTSINVFLLMYLLPVVYKLQLQLSNSLGPEVAYNTPYGKTYSNSQEAF
jgi:hypothetical protein